MPIFIIIFIYKKNVISAGIYRSAVRWGGVCFSVLLEVCTVALRVGYRTKR